MSASVWSETGCVFYASWREHLKAETWAACSTLGRQEPRDMTSDDTIRRPETHGPDGRDPRWHPVNSSGPKSTSTWLRRFFWGLCREPE
jgi:hypothetical protein